MGRERWGGEGRSARGPSSAASLGREQRRPRRPGEGGLGKKRVVTPTGAFCHRRRGCRVVEGEEPRPPEKLAALNGAGSLKSPHSPLAPRPPPPGAAPPPPHPHPSPTSLLGLSRRRASTGAPGTCSLLFQEMKEAPEEGAYDFRDAQRLPNFMPHGSCSFLLENRL